MTDRSIRPYRVTLASLVLLLACGVIDYYSPPEVRLYVLYFIPTGIISWYRGKSDGLIFAILAGTVWLVAAISSPHSYAASMWLLWNCLVQITGFLIVAIIIAGLASREKARDHTISGLDIEKRRIEESGKVLAGDLEHAQAAQMAMVAQEKPVIPGLAIHTIYKPAMQVGGDVLSIHALDNKRSVFVIGDVVGHGITAALNMAVVSSITRRAIQEHADPGSILNAVNVQLCKSFEVFYVTMVCCMIDTEKSTATLAIAGHPPPIVVRHTNLVEDLIRYGNLPVGFEPTTTYENHEFRLFPEDVMVFLTDGIAEARNGARETLGYEAIYNCLREVGNADPRDIGNSLIDTMRRHCKDIPIEDDVSVLIIKLRPS